MMNIYYDPIIVNNVLCVHLELWKKRTKKSMKTSPQHEVRKECLFQYFFHGPAQVPHAAVIKPYRQLHQLLHYRYLIIMFFLSVAWLLITSAGK